MATFAQLPLWGVEAKLWTADPNWVQRLRIGYGRWCVCMLIGLLILLATLMMASFFRFNELPLVVQMMLIQAWCVPWLLIGWGLFQATVAPRHENQSLRWRLGRSFCRICAVLRVLLWMLIGFTMMTDNVFAYETFAMYIGLAVIVLLLVEMAAWWSLFLYLRPLVRTLLPNAMSLWYLALFCGVATVLAGLLNVGWAIYLQYSASGYFYYSRQMVWLEFLPGWLSNIGPFVGLLWLAWIYALTWMLWRTLRRFRAVAA
ncbi:MAG: hypothetical protein IT445_06475 [Phycisphaeraceae bacterium]|nr:hypothetical protein [Phycisphaeraceae bacterium]